MFGGGEADEGVVAAVVGEGAVVFVDETHAEGEHGDREEEDQEEEGEEFYGGEEEGDTAVEVEGFEEQAGLDGGCC